MPHRENKIIIKGEVARRSIEAGAFEVFDSVATTYGPMSGNVGIQKNWGLGRITHDGVTVAREIFLKNDAENFGATHLSAASKKTNEAAGDGTSATVILGYTVLSLANRQVFSRRNPMLMKRGIIRAALDAKDAIDAMKRPILDAKDGKTPEGLIKVATISASGDAAIGALIADTVHRVGKGVTIEEYAGLNVEQEIVEGFYYDQGWASPHLSAVIESEDANPVRVLITERSITKVAELFPLLKKLDDARNTKLVIVGSVTGPALTMVTDFVRNNQLEIGISQSPIFGQQRSEFLLDVATVTGGKVVTNLGENISLDLLGKCGRAVYNQKSTTLFSGQGDPEQVMTRIDETEAKLKAETVDVVREHMTSRLAKLRGKIGLIRVGGATESEVKEKKDRVDDAVHATQAAQEDGIVAGGATALLEVRRRLLEKLGATAPVPVVSRVVVRETDMARGSTVIQDHARGVMIIENPTDVQFAPGAAQTDMQPDELEGYRVVLDAFLEPFKVLMTNSGQSADYNLEMVLEAGYGFGYNAEAPTKKPVDLWEAGVVDPAKVIKLEIENGCSVAAELVTTKSVIAHVDLAKVEQIEDEDV